MNQQLIPGPGALQHLCMSAIIENLIHNGRMNSIDDLPLPASIVQEIKEIYKWKSSDIPVILNLIHLKGDIFAHLPNTSPFFGHFRWTNENGTVKIDRRATASAQLDNFDPSTASMELVEYGFVLAAMYCLENHIQKLFPHRSPLFVSSPTNIPAVIYWSGTLGLLPMQMLTTTYLYGIYMEPLKRQEGSSDFWLAVVRSFWPVANQQLNGVNFQRWINIILRYAMDERHKSVIDYVWARYTTDDMRKSLVSDGMYNNRRFICSALRANENGILLDFLTLFDDHDARREAISGVLDEICAYFKVGHNSEMVEQLLDYMIVDCTSISAAIAHQLCKLLSLIWDCVLSPEKRDRISNQFVDLLRYAVEFGQIEMATRIWNEEQSQVRKFEILFQDEYAAFRTSCANGHLELVQSFWEWASVEQQYLMIGSQSGDALNTAARNGRLSVVRYLWENMMDWRVAFEAIDSHGIDDVALSQLITVDSSNEADGSPSHELERFLSMLVSTPSDGREPIYPLAVIKGILANALTLNDGKALNVLVQRAKDGGDDDRSMLRSLIGVFNDKQRVRMRSKLTTEDDIKMCGLESMEISARLQAMAIRSVRAEDDGEEDGEEDEEERNGEMIDLTEALTDEYFDLFLKK